MGFGWLSLWVFAAIGAIAGLLQMFDTSVPRLWVKFRTMKSGATKPAITPATAKGSRAFAAIYLAVGLSLMAVLIVRQTSDVDQLATLRGEVAKLQSDLAERDATIADLKKQPSATVQPIRQVFKSLPLKPDEINFVNVGIENGGPYTARNAGYAAKIRLYPTPHSTAEEKQFLDEFSDLVKRQLDIEVKRDVIKNGSIWRSIEFGFNQETIDDLYADRQRLYVLLRYRWEDKSGAHEAEQCTYLRPPPTENVWRLCDSHNVAAE